MRVLVVGAAGFIGSHTVLELLEAGHSVIAVDNFSNSIANGESAISLNRVSKLVGRAIPFVKADLCDADQLRGIFEQNKIDAVIHLAALKAVGESCEKPLEYYANNLIGSITLLQMCKEMGVCNFIFSSSATVYGPPRELPIREDAQTGVGITNPYGQTKHMVEQILFDLAKAEPHWNIVILRYFNPVGAHPSGEIGEDPKGIPNNLMPYVSQVAIGKLPYVKLYGTKFPTPDGTGVRDYIHIVDLAKGHVSALNRIEKEGKIGCEVYNLGTGKGYSVLEMVAALEKASGRKIETREDVPRTGDVACVYCDPTLAATKLGWKAELDLDAMCRDLWNWQSKNPNGFREQ